MSHFIPEKFEDNLSIVNKIVYQHKQTKYKPIEGTTMGSIIHNLSSFSEEVDVLKVILKSKKEDVEILKDKLEEIMYKDGNV